MEEMDFQGLLDRFNQGHYTRGEAVILSNFGTNQTMLSIIFNQPCRLEVEDQGMRYYPPGDTEGYIHRKVHLVYGKWRACEATTKIPLAYNCQAVLDMVLAGTRGLGQIVVELNLPNRRVLLDVGRDDKAFWRTYAIEGAELHFEVHEYFPREPLLAVGWDVEFGPGPVPANVPGYRIGDLQFKKDRSGFPGIRSYL
jgi:chorismate-pyruvate lyase